MRIPPKIEAFPSLKPPYFWPLPFNACPCPSRWSPRKSLSTCLSLRRPFASRSFALLSPLLVVSFPEAGSPLFSLRDHERPLQFPDCATLVSVCLPVATMSNKVRDLFDVDIFGLEHAGDVTLTSSEALHQWSDAIVVSYGRRVPKTFQAQSSCDHGRSCPSWVRMLSASFDV